MFLHNPTIILHVFLVIIRLINLETTTETVQKPIKVVLKVSEPKPFYMPDEPTIVDPEPIDDPNGKTDDQEKSKDTEGEKDQNDPDNTGNSDTSDDIQDDPYEPEDEEGEDDLDDFDDGDFEIEEDTDKKQPKGLTTNEQPNINTGIVKGNYLAGIAGALAVLLGTVLINKKNKE